MHIDSNQIEYLGRGANRYTIVHPENKARCLKLPTDGTQGANLNQLEYQAYQQLAARALQSDAFFVECYGLVDTNLGQALEVERLFLPNQQPALSLHQWLQDKSLQQAYPVNVIVAMIEQFTAYLIANDLPIFDLNSGNLMLCEHQDQLALKYVDVKSLLESKEILPISRWFKGLMHRKVKRRAERLKQRILSAQ
ncbi:YrbL family protein [uncultured Acinetobacter sp.]|uniref:YrbL family protein n=1 Tax=uncultured Acinetobacter sp. TaxID=165433 RepID=UPI002613606C|nr:YrbL family protein [uncultured Acinetobacter sp.]